jgi:hypothetical protein
MSGDPDHDHVELAMFVCGRGALRFVPAQQDCSATRPQIVPGNSMLAMRRHSVPNMFALSDNCCSAIILPGARSGFTAAV